MKYLQETLQILEKKSCIRHWRLNISFLEAKGFLSRRLFGFRPKYWTKDALASLSLFINKALDMGLVPAAILLYVSRIWIK